MLKLGSKTEIPTNEWTRGDLSTFGAKIWVQIAGWANVYFGKSLCLLPHNISCCSLRAANVNRVDSPHAVAPDINICVEYMLHMLLDEISEPSALKWVYCCQMFKDYAPNSRTLSQTHMDSHGNMYIWGCRSYQWALLLAKTELEEWRR